MVDIIRIIGMGLAVTLLVLVIRQQRPELAVQLSLALAVTVFLLVIDKIALALNLLEDLAAKANVSQNYLNTVLKIIGIAYVTEFGAQVCRDAGEGAVAAKVEFAGKVCIIVMSIPVIALVLDTVVKLMP